MKWKIKKSKSPFFNQWFCSCECISNFLTNPSPRWLAKSNLASSGVKVNFPLGKLVVANWMSSRAALFLYKNSIFCPTSKNSTDNLTEVQKLVHNEPPARGFGGLMWTLHPGRLTPLEINSQSPEKEANLSEAANASGPGRIVTLFVYRQLSPTLLTLQQWCFFEFEFFWSTNINYIHGQIFVLQFSDETITLPIPRWFPISGTFSEVPIFEEKFRDPFGSPNQFTQTSSGVGSRKSGIKKMSAGTNVPRTGPSAGLRLAVGDLRGSGSHTSPAMEGVDWWLGCVCLAHFF